MDPKPDRRTRTTSVWRGFREWLANIPPVSLLALAVILAVIIYCFGTRYKMVGTGKGAGYIYNRITGACWLVYGDKYQRIGAKPASHVSQVTKPDQPITLVPIK